MAMLVLRLKVPIAAAQTAVRTNPGLLAAAWRRSFPLLAFIDALLKVSFLRSLLCNVLVSCINSIASSVPALIHQETDEHNRRAKYPDRGNRVQTKVPWGWGNPGGGENAPNSGARRPKLILGAT
ncbi:hypothetical protein [Ramlibacter alkalitolerans]|uniref:Uncharacterized protein n=1 Tax=Ramlibacter alkalitolerans TaxID=2039631 RepID=A0ABS1JIA2_9BURK|nr:hypothetical protein [Ramlibacter alkalitolerans]